MKTKTIALATIYTTLYVALSLSLAPISFGAIQVRVAGALLGAVPIIGIAGVIGQTLGCAITNSFSALGIIDLFNVIPTFIGVFVIWKLRNKSILAGFLFYSSLTAISVAVTLHFAFNLPIPITILTVFIGQLIACVIGAYFVNKSLGKIFHKKAD